MKLVGLQRTAFDGVQTGDDTGGEVRPAKGDQFTAGSPDLSRSVKLGYDVTRSVYLGGRTEASEGAGNAALLIVECQPVTEQADPERETAQVLILAGDFRAPGVLFLEDLFQATLKGGCGDIPASAIDQTSGHHGEAEKEDLAARL